MIGGGTITIGREGDVGVALSGLETVVARSPFCACYILYILY